jgi:hypothetical protein
MAIRNTRKRLRNRRLCVCLRCEEETAPKLLQVIPGRLTAVMPSRMEGQGQALAPVWMRAA